jgi:hypothetical protein
MSHDVFISYRRDGGEHLAGRIKDALKSRGFSVFMDVEDLKSGKFDLALLREIEAATDVVVILTPGCLERCKNEDDWFRQEIRHAIKCERNIVPILARDFQMPSPATLAPDIAELVTYNGLTPASELFEASIDRLVSKFLKSRLRTSEAGRSSKITSLDGEVSSFVRKNLIWILSILALVAVLLSVSIRRPPKDETIHQAVTQKLHEALDSHGVRVDCTECTVQDPHVNVHVEDGKVSLTGALRTSDLEIVRGVPLDLAGVKAVEYQVQGEQASSGSNISLAVTQPKAAAVVKMKTGGDVPAMPASSSKEPTEDELRARAYVVTGQEQLRNGNYVSAENRFHAALNLDPQNASAKAGLAQAVKSKNKASD